ncbi:MAG: OsmC family protein [Acidimicrobiales bacterium]|jgi:organic hydroperoxide reductase OsmC/OhrA
MSRTHSYEVSLRWTGNTGSGTSSYRSYGRDHELSAPGKPMIDGSSDPAFRGDPQRWNPEELLVAALSQCHMLSYLHLAASAGVIVTAYRDTPTGTMTENPDGSGEFVEVTLRPEVTVAEAAMRERATALHDDAEKLCFIARSVNFPVHHLPLTVAAPAGGPWPRTDSKPPLC